MTAMIAMTVVITVENADVFSVFSTGAFSTGAFPINTFFIKVFFIGVFFKGKCSPKKKHNGPKSVFHRNADRRLVARRTWHLRHFGSSR